MTTKIKWRLSKLPDSHEVSLLLEKGVLTKEEAREILFSLETEEDRDKQSLQEEIKFLRQLVQGMSLNRQNIVEHIYKYEKPYSNSPWWGGYQAYCSTTSGNSTMTTATAGLSGSNSIAISGSATNLSNAVYTATSSDGTSAIYSFSEPSFTDIATF